MSRVMPITVALAAVLAAAPGALAQVTSGQKPDVSPWPTVGRDTGTTAALGDTTYIGQALRANFLEVGLGRLAESRAADSTVEEFGRLMISEHSFMNESWKTLAVLNRMDTDEDLGPAGEQSVERLEDLDDAAFDQAYMTEMIQRHEQDLAAFQRMAAARSPKVRQLADTGVSNSREHLALARQVGSRVGVSMTAGRVGGDPAPAPSDDDRRRTADDRRRTAADRATRERDDRDDRGRLRAEDRAFLENVLAGHLMHIRLAERAQREARSDEIRRFAERMKEDYKEWQERWQDVAARYDIKAPSHLGTLHGQKVERLERASKGNVDRTYAAIVAENLASVVPYYEKEGQAVRPAAARRLVDEELPMIRENLERARRLQGQASAREKDSDRD